MSSSTRVPVIDFTSPTLSQDIRSACINVGFFHLVNHGICPNLQSQLYQEMRTFFSSSTVEKSKVLVNTRTFRGYMPMEEEHLDPTKQLKGDTKEAYHIGRHVPLDSEEAQLPLHGPNLFPDVNRFPHFEQVTVEYFNQLSKLGYALAQAMAEAAHAPGALAGEGKFDRPMAVLRLLHYSSETSDAKRGVFAAGEHTDYGLLTLLSTDDTPGLEIEFQGKWIPVPILQNAFVVNIGDMTERWTNGLFKSTKHRVMNYAGVERYSVPFFYEPNFNCQVECFPSCVSAERPARYTTTTSGKHLLSKYRQTHASYSDSSI